MNTHRYCVIMCGGIGSRFWPYSRTDVPKQFLDFLGSGRSLLQMSYDRILPIVPAENIVIVTNAAYAELVAQQLPDIKPENILLEPARRNTAPCIAWAAWHIAAKDPQASMIVTPSDHLITREQIFVDTVERGMTFVEDNDALLTMGITPTRPETGYGYIQVGAETETEGINMVKTFTEKPNLELAHVLLASGEFLWNSGIFMWRADSIKRAIQAYAPEIALQMEGGVEFFATVKETQFIDKVFPACPAISIDYAVMEKAKNVYVERADFGWSDLGTWSALYENSPKNRDGNVTQRATVMAYDATGNIVTAPGDKLVVIDGLKDYIVADTPDVLLICPMEKEQSIKQIVNDVKDNFADGKYL